MQRKPPRELLEEFNAYIKSDTIFSSKARLLQSLWRDRNGLPIGIHQINKNSQIELGSIIDESYARNYYSNFLTRNIARLVEKEIMNHQKMIQEPRIWNNLLSSQPLAFNLFGELKVEPGYVTTKRILDSFFPGEVGQVENIRFEYSPERKNPDLTNDNSAFDVFIEYRSITHESCFIGIEIKYAENMRDKPAKNRIEYEKVAKQMDIFKGEAYDQLRNTCIQQLWRDHLLAGSMFISTDLYQKGKFAIIYPEENYQCRNAVDKYKNTFKCDDFEEAFFYPISLEDFVSRLQNICDKQWVDDFESRYLDFERIENLI
jgi:hypothetical protein